MDHHRQDEVGNATLPSVSCSFESNGREIGQTKMLQLLRNSVNEMFAPIEQGGSLLAQDLVSWTALLLLLASGQET